MSYISWALSFFDRHSGFISAVGLILAAIGLLLTVRQLSLYRQELRDRATEEERFAWERILKMLHQVAQFAGKAHVSSAVHSPWNKQLGYVPPEIEAMYGPAQDSLLSYWHQLRVELSLMPDGPLVRTIESFMDKYNDSADGRASKAFLDDLPAITHAVTEHAQKSFHTGK